MRNQRGLTTVEFAVTAVAVLVVLFAALEFGRLMYTEALIGEGARRAARLAVVCPVNDPKITSVAAFTDLGIAPRGLAPSNVVVEYLDESGTPLADLSHYSAIYQVRVRINGVQFSLNIPLMSRTITINETKVTLPRESLGFHAAGATGAC